MFSWWCSESGPGPGPWVSPGKWLEMCIGRPLAGSLTQQLGWSQHPVHQALQAIILPAEGREPAPKESWLTGQGPWVDHSDWCKCSDNEQCSWLFLSYSSGCQLSQYILQNKEHKTLHNLYRLRKVECHYVISTHFLCWMKNFTSYFPLEYTKRDHIMVNFALKLNETSKLRKKNMILSKEYRTIFRKEKNSL